MKPTAPQMRYLRALAEQTGTTFSPPQTKAEASQEITRLKRRTTNSTADITRERREVIGDLQQGAGDAVRHRAAETTGYGSGAHWTHNAEAHR